MKRINLYVIRHILKHDFFLCFGTLHLVWIPENIFLPPPDLLQPLIVPISKFPGCYLNCLVCWSSMTYVGGCGSGKATRSFFLIYSNNFFLSIWDISSLTKTVLGYFAYWGLLGLIGEFDASFKFS